MQPDLHREGYGIFVRCCDLSPRTPVAEFAFIIEQLDSIIGNEDFFPSPYGGAIYRRQIDEALAAARALTSGLGPFGISAAIGIAWGRFQRTVNVRDWNAAALPVNQAARLAFCDAAKGRVLLTPKVREAAGAKIDCSGKGECVVKGARYEYHSIESPGYALNNKRRPDSSGAPPSYEPNIALWDIVKYSTKDPDEQAELSERLAQMTTTVLQTLNVKQADYSPTGDGGFALFETGLRAIAFARQLGSYVASMGITIRTGINHGEITFAKRGPIGPGILRADEISSVAPHNGIALPADVWNTLDKVSRKSWRTSQIANTNILKLEVASDEEKSNTSTISPAAHAEQPLHVSGLSASKPEADSHQLPTHDGRVRQASSLGPRHAWPNWRQILYQIGVAVALIVALTRIKELTTALQEFGIPTWLGIALIATIPFLALVLSTIPIFMEQRHIRSYGEISGSFQTGYFTLRPRENEEGFERADNAHQDTLRWIQTTREPVLYLTGASGTGKSSLLSAWVIPKLRRERHVVIQMRGYEDDPLGRIKERLLEPGVIWDRPPRSTDDLRTLLGRASQRLGDRRLVIIIDQFEEFLILTDEEHRRHLQQFVTEEPIAGLIFLLVFRPEYEGLIQDQPWPRLRLDTNRKVISSFTEKAAQDFMEKSGLKIHGDLMPRVLREAAEIEQTTGLIRPVTINLCGLVLSRFSSGLPSRFRGGLIRGFLRESLALPEVREAAGRLIPHLISENVTKRPRRIEELVQATQLAPFAVRACLRRLGERDRAIVRPLDEQQETWEISHDFLVPILDSIMSRHTASPWRRVRPWLPGIAAAVAGTAAIAIPLVTTQNPVGVLTGQGWVVTRDGGSWQVRRGDAIPPGSVSTLHRLPPPLSMILSGPNVTDISALRELKNLTQLNIGRTNVRDISALRELKNLTQLDLSGTEVTGISALHELKNLTQLDLSGTEVTDISPLRELNGLTQLDLSSTKVSNLLVLHELRRLTDLRIIDTKVTDVSPVRELKNLTQLSLAGTSVTDISALRELMNLTHLDLSRTTVTDISVLHELKNLTRLDLTETSVTDISAIRGLNNLTELDLEYTKVMAVSALGELNNLVHLDLGQTSVTDVSGLRLLSNLTYLDLSGTKISDVSALRELKKLIELDIDSTRVTDISALRGLQTLTHLDLSEDTLVRDISAVGELQSLTYLDLSETSLTDITVLRYLHNLTHLDLTDVKGVTDLSALQDLQNLAELDISGTRVKDLSALRGLRRLTQLQIIDTNVTDVSPLRELKSLKIEQ